MRKILSPNLSRTALVASIGLLTAMPASAERLVMPDWGQLFSSSGDVRSGHARGGEASLIQDKISNGRAQDDTVRIPRTRNVEVNGVMKKRRIYLENTFRTGRVHRNHDLGNSYALTTEDASGAQQIYAAAEHLNHGRVNSQIEFELNREAPVITKRGRVTKVKGRELAGDIKARVVLRRGKPVQFLVQRRMSGKWRTAMRAKFRRNGCAGRPAVAMACVSELPNGGPVPANTGSVLPNGRPFPVPNSNSMVEIGLNMERLVNDKAIASVLTVRTPQDAAVGTISGEAQ